MTISSAPSTRGLRHNALSTKVDLLCLALLFVFSNHCPASLLSPELFLSEVSCGDTLDGGLALSLARVGELRLVFRSLGCRPDAEAGGLCRRETDLWAGGRRGWFMTDFGMVPGGSFMVAGVMCRVIVRGCSPYAQEGGRYRNAGGYWYVGIVV